MSPITYVSDQASEYATALAAAESLEALRAVTAAYGDLCEDAHEIAEGLDEAGFKRWRKGLAKERRGIFAGEKFAQEFGALQMPEVMFKVSMVAVQCGAPWGCAYIRLKEAGKLPTRGDHLPR